MSPDNIWTIKVILGVLGGLFGVLAAVLGFCETAQNEKYDDTKAWFGDKWQSINRSRWLTLPQHSIEWFIRAGKTDWSMSLGNLFFSRAWVLRVIGVLVPVILLLACLYYWGVKAAVVIAIFSIPVIQELGMERRFDVKLLGEKLSELYVGISVVVIFGGMVTVWTYVLLRLSVYYSALIMLILFPFYWVVAFFPLYALDSLGLKNEIQNKLILFILGVAAGFTVTFIALLIGHAADPTAYVPQTFQVLASNVLFDGLTMVVTFTILSWVVGRGWLFSIPLAVFLDLVAAAVLACCSLYFALIGTEHALSAREVLWVLVAHSPDGSRVELSPYFWTMHTTFLPTFAYLALILVTWFAKLLLTPVRWFFGKGHAHKSPLKLTAALCGMLAVIFGLFTVGANSAYERAKEKAAAAAPPAIVK